MREIRNVLLIGLGAVGGAYAKKLYDMDPDSIQVLAGGERAKRYQESGIFINNQRYEFHYADPEVPSEPADLIIVAVKFYDLDAAIRSMRNYVGDHTIILSLMNGISSEELIGAVYGMDKLLYGLVIGIDGNREKNQIHFTSYGTIVFGKKQNQIRSSKVEAVAKLFEKADIQYSIPDDMMHARWNKFMMNIGINQSSAVLLANYGVFQKSADAYTVIESAMGEVIQIADKIGVHLDEQDLKKWRQVVDGMNPESRTSMHDDLVNGRKTEVEMLSGTIIKLGLAHSVATPVNQLLYHLIKAREQMNEQNLNRLPVRVS